MKKLTKVAALMGGASVLTALLAGCTTSTEGWRVSAAEEICAQRGGIDHLVNFLGSAVVCRDGFFAEMKGKP